MHEIFRRTFLKGSAAALATASAGPMLLFARPAASRDDGMGRARFEALLGHWFYVDDLHPTLQLARIDDGPVASGTEQFTLIFRGPADHSLPESTYALTPEGQTTFEIHLAPTGRDAEGTTLAAAFCRRRLGGPGCAGASG